MLRHWTIPGTQKARAQHVGFWLIFVSLMVVSVSRAPGTPLSAGGIAIRVIVLLGITATASYVNLGLLAPRFLLTRRYGVYSMVLTATILLAGLSIGVVYQQLLDVGRMPGEAITEHPSEVISGRFPGQGAFDGAEHGSISKPDLLRLSSIFTVHTAIWVGATALLHFGASWLRSRELEQRRLKEELTALKAQLNPHFLFNSLNIIYALAIEKSDLGPNYVLKLAELMRYILHEGQASEVPMGREIEFIRSYFELEEMHAEGRLETEFRIGEGVAELKVAPLLFLPFVENAFKHGVKMKSGQASVEFSASLTPDGALEIQVTNYKSARGSHTDRVGHFANPGGVGLENVRRRLELLYPERHRLQIHDKDNRFEVTLRVES